MAAPAQLAAQPFVYATAPAAAYTQPAGVRAPKDLMFCGCLAVRACARARACSRPLVASGERLSTVYLKHCEAGSYGLVAMATLRER
eukprot:3630053-Pleurochrysis_carterae.AAC.1